MRLIVTDRSGHSERIRSQRPLTAETLVGFVGPGKSHRDKIDANQRRLGYHRVSVNTVRLGRRDQRCIPRKCEGREIMLYTVAVILIVLWLLGLVSSYTMGGFIHILLVIAIIVVLLNVIQGRKVL